jgi:hypothetical protein
MPTLSTMRADRQLFDDVELDVDEPDPAALELFELSEVAGDDELSPDDEPPSEPDEPVPFESPAADVDAALDADFLPRLSVLKKPEPLKVTPTGVKTFFTASSSPLSGWAISVRFSSWKPCWTSIVSPVSTNLYT